MSAIRMIAAVALLLVAGKAYSQAPAPPFSLKASVTPSTAKTDSDFVIQVALTNITKERQYLEVCRGASVDCNFTIDVRDSHGNSLAQLRPSLVSSLAGTSLEPGETLKFLSKLSKLFDLGHPGRYEVQVRKGYLRSNITQITVAGQ